MKKAKSNIGVVYATTGCNQSDYASGFPLPSPSWHRPPLVSIYYLRIYVSIIKIYCQTLFLNYFKYILIFGIVPVLILCPVADCVVVNFTWFIVVANSKYIKLADDTEIYHENNVDMAKLKK